MQIFAGTDSYLQHLKESRDTPATLKLKLVSFRSERPNGFIFAFEGITDKTIYYHWVQRISPSLKYEPFPCDGKRHLLQLKEITERDLNNLGDGIYFFVDHDFDGLRGHQPSEKTFMTVTHSVENCLVSEIVLEEILKNEFHCHGHVLLRSKVQELFMNIYNSFLEQTQEVNYRLFLSQRLKIEQRGHLPTKIKHLANVALEKITNSETAPEDIVRLAREPDPEERSALYEEFSKYNKKDRYRGKFSLMFFKCWLNHLADDRNSENSTLFPDLDRKIKVDINQISLHSLASKSEIPIGLKEFIHRIVVIATEEMLPR